MPSKFDFVCQNCQARFPKWEGRCRNCGEWNSLAEQARSAQTRGQPNRPAQIFSLADVPAEHLARFSSGIPELDFILGGAGAETGIVPGALVLLGGDPGIGKSTLALQIAIGLAQAGLSTVYCSGEESLGQLRLRAARLRLPLAQLSVIVENNLDALLAALEGSGARFAVIDSIQTLYSEATTGVAGGSAQVAYATNRIMELAKRKGVATLIIGHVTKEGNLAGPRMLEHMVDVVLYLEGERFASYRILRCVKNRFGATSEAGVFEMTEAGLETVANPSAIFLAEHWGNKTGAAVSCAIEGTRPLLLEIQALTGKSQFNYPRRTATGFDLNRLLLLAAVLQRHFSAKIAEEDIFLSVAGGYRITETACDLAVAASIVSSYKDVAVPADLVLMGELGLSGELRMVGQAPKRISEAAKLGFKRILLPQSNKAASSKIKLLPARNLSDALKHIGVK